MSHQNRWPVYSVLKHIDVFFLFVKERNGILPLPPPLPPPLPLPLPLVQAKIRGAGGGDLKGCCLFWISPILWSSDPPILRRSRVKRGRAQKRTLKTEGWGSGEGSTGERRGAEGEDHTDTMRQRDVRALWQICSLMHWHPPTHRPSPSCRNSGTSYKSQGEESLPPPSDTFALLFFNLLMHTLSLHSLGGRRQLRMVPWFHLWLLQKHPWLWHWCRSQAPGDSMLPPPRLL